MNIDLKAANEELDAFARTVSHDLQSPLAGIIGFVQLIIEDGSDKLEEETVENLNWVLQSAYRMSELIVDLLNYSRSGRASINCEPLDLSEMVNELVSDYRVRNQDNKFPLSEDNLMVNADSAMRIALTNILNNAIKYSGNAENPEIIWK